MTSINPRTVKIGFIGNVGNGMYTMASCFRAMGYNAYYYHIPSNFMFCQPFWEDGNYYVAYKDLENSSLARELRQTWHKPEWVVERDIPWIVKKVFQMASAKRYLTWSEWLRPSILRELSSEIFPLFRDELRSCDWLIASSIAAVLACQEARVPYVFIPHGQDLRDASGQKELIRREPNIKVIAGAIQGATLYGSHGADMIRLLEKLGDPERAVALPIIVNPDLYRRPRASWAFPFLPEPIVQRASSGERIVLFMPSRFSDRWKGTDLFMSAFLNMARKYHDKLLLIAAGWGTDFPKYKEMVDKEPSVKPSVFFMDGAISKGYLREILSVVDVVVDQFVLGWYGTALIEAASAGKMTLLHFDQNQWRQHMHELEAPPVLPTGTSEQIAAILEDLVLGKIRSREEGQKLSAWAEKNHGMKQWVPRMIEKMQTTPTKALGDGIG